MTTEPERREVRAVAPPRELPRIRTGLTCARTGTARGAGACLAGTAGTCACVGWTA